MRLLKSTCFHCPKQKFGWPFAPPLLSGLQKNGMESSIDEVPQVTDLCRNGTQVEKYASLLTQLGMSFPQSMCAKAPEKWLQFLCMRWYRSPRNSLPSSSKILSTSPELKCRRASVLIGAIYLNKVVFKIRSLNHPYKTRKFKNKDGFSQKAI